MTELDMSPQCSTWKPARSNCANGSRIKSETIEERQEPKVPEKLPNYPSKLCSDESK